MAMKSNGWLHLIAIAMTTLASQMTSAIDAESAYKLSAKTVANIAKELPAIVELVLVRSAELDSTSMNAEEIIKLPPDQQRLRVLNESLMHQRFPEFDLLSQQPLPISLEIVTEDGVVVQECSEPSKLAFYSHVSSPGIHAEAGELLRPFVTLSEIPAYTWWFDVSPFLSTLPDGNYIVRVKLYSSTYGWASNAVPITVASTKPVSWELLKQAIPSLPNEPKAVSIPELLKMEIDEEVLDAIDSALPSAVSESIWSVHLLVEAAKLTHAEGRDQLIPKHLLSLEALLTYEAALPSMTIDASQARRDELVESFPGIRRHLDRMRSGNKLAERFRSYLKGADGR